MCSLNVQCVLLLEIVYHRARVPAASALIQQTPLRAAGGGPQARAAACDGSAEES